MAEDILKGKTEEELWSLYHNNRDPVIRDFFVRQYAPLVKYVAGKVAMGMPNNVEFDIIGLKNFETFMDL